MTRRVDPLLPEFAREALSSADLTEQEERAWCEALGAGLPNSLGRVEATARARERLLAAIVEVPQRYAPFFRRLSQLFDLDEMRVEQILTRTKNAASWQAGPLPGLLLMHFEGGPRVADADVGLVRIPTGCQFPTHRHLGYERVFILEGSYRDDAGKLWGPGDLHEMPPNSKHAYQVMDQELLFALVLHAGVEIEGFGTFP